MSTPTPAKLPPVTAENIAACLGVAFTNSLSVNPIRTLCFLHRQPSLSLGTLSNLLGLTSSAITGICDQLEKLGYASRRHSKDDRRNIYLDLSDKGREVIKAILNPQVGSASASASS